MIKAIAFDWDGTLADSWKGHPVIATFKNLVFKAWRPLYIIVELAELCLRIRWNLHSGARRLLYEILERDLPIGIITDRSLFSVIIAMRRAKLPMEMFSFIHARKSCFDRFALHLVPGRVVIMTTPYYKGDSRALVALMEFFARLDIKPHEVFFIGDDKRDCLAAEQCGFKFERVDRMRPVFKTVRNVLSLD